MTRTAVVGAGTISTHHLAAIAELPEAELVAICDTDPILAEVAGKRWGAPVFTDHRAMLDQVRPDVVHVCTPHDAHVQVAVDALEAGSHVLTEKPLAHTMTEAHRLVEAAAHPALQAGVCFQNRYNDTSVALREAISGGRYGAVRGARADVWWHRTPAYYAAAPWRASWARAGGGTLVNQSIHTVDLLGWLLGTPVAVTGWATSLGALDERGGPAYEVEDCALVELEHPGAVRSAMYATNRHHEDSPVRIEVACERATLRLDEGRLTAATSDGPTEVLADDEPASGAKSYWGSSHRRLIADFYYCVATGRAFPVPVAEGIPALAAAREVYRRSGLIAEP